MKIKELPKTERPREKLERYGLQKLADNELLALMLGSGVRGTNVIQLANKILKELRSKDYNFESLLKIHGLGKAKTMQLLASLEFGKRLNTQAPETVISPEKIFELCGDFRESKKEHIVVFYLDTRNVLITREIISLSTLNESLLHPRDVFEPALRHSAANVVIAHNHPFGDINPSQEDKEITLKIREAGSLLGIDLLDHIILGKGRYLSFKEQGLLS